MIRHIVFGDITDYGRDMIIGMNTELGEPSALGRPFVHNVSVLKQIDLGSVLSFKFDNQRFLHMLICHRLGSDGWIDTDKYVRYCLDYLWQQHGMREYSIVQIGNGPVGQRDGADVPAIRTAMADSFLKVDLVILPERAEARVAVEMPILAPFRVWDMEKGEREIRLQ